MKIYPLFQLMCPSVDSIDENIFMDISSSQFYQKYYYIPCNKWCKC